MNQPIPASALAHCVLLFEARTNFVPVFFQSFARHFPGSDGSQRGWTSVTQPRPCAFGPISWQGWKWHILIDLHGMPPQVASILEQAQMSCMAKDAMDQHQIAAMIFLTEVPETASEADQRRALTRAAWSMLDAGASVLIWPRTELAWHRHELENFNPEDFDPSWNEGI